MKTDSLFKSLRVIFTVALCSAGAAWAGPGTIVVPTDPNLGVELRLGGQVRVVPVLESNWGRRSTW